MLTWLRSALFNGAFFLTTAIMAILGAPFLLLGSERLALGYARLWARVVVFLLRALAGVRLEIRGRANIPAGGALVAAKHQSAIETFAVFPILATPTLVMKTELRKIPLFGRFTEVTGMIEIDRAKGSTALRDMVHRGREEAAKGRQIVIFPEGTRRPPGADPAYQPGIALLYKGLGLPTVPVALNSGLYWPRRSFLKYPGTIVIEFLPPIEPGLDSRTFLTRLETAIEAASDRLLAEAARSPAAPPMPPQAAARLIAIGKG